nr:ribonuclease H-like domain-containing protein [Tanacetum cinerariifolium]
MDDVRHIWNAVKARFGGNAESKKIRKSMLKQEFLEFRISKAEGLHKGYDRMQKILSPLNQLKAKPEDEDINLKFLRALPSSWSQVASTLKTKDVLQSFVADTEPKQQLAYEDFKQIEILDMEEMDLKWKMAMLSVRVHKFKQKAGRKIEFDKKESARFNKKKTNHDGESDGVIASKEFGMIAGCDTEYAIEEGRPLFHRFAKADSMKVVSPPLSEDYTSLSDHNDLDESQMSYGTKSSTFSDSKSVSNDFVSCDDCDKSSEVNINDFASSDSSVKSSKPKPNDSTSCALTSSVSTSENEAEI